MASFFQTMADDPGLGKTLVCPLAYTVTFPGNVYFNELNVRTYVVLNGKPGVFFFSLDANHQWTVWGARLKYALPYYLADIRADMNAMTKQITYHCQRKKSEKPDPIL